MNGSLTGTSYGRLTVGSIKAVRGCLQHQPPGSTDLKDFAFIFVPAETPGVTQGGPYQKAGMAADKNGDIWFEDVRVPVYYRACGPGDDYLYFKEVISFGKYGQYLFCQRFNDECL